MFSIIVCKGYNEMSFKEDLKKLFLMIGVDNKPLVFFLTQSQISDESNVNLFFRLIIIKLIFDIIHILNEIRIKGFLETINNILMIGMAPALFTEEEKDEIVNGVRKHLIAAGYDNTK